jgi:hypothetical protein
MRIPGPHGRERAGGAFELDKTNQKPRRRTMRNRNLFKWALLAVAALLSPALAAAPIIWTGAGDGTTWTDTANWAGNAVPAGGDEAIFDGTATPTTITGVSGNIERIEVDSGANPALNITFELTADLTLTGNGGSLDVAAGDAATFDGANTTAHTLFAEEDFAIAGSVSFNTDITVRVTTGLLTISMADGSSLDLAGALEVYAATVLAADASGTAPVISIGELRINGSSFNLDTLGGNPSATLGAISFFGSNPYLGGYNMLSFADRWTVTVTGDIDGGGSTDAMIEADYVYFEFPAASTIQSSTPFAFWWMGRVTVPAGGSLTANDGLFSGNSSSGALWLIYQLRVGGNFDAGDNSLWYAGHAGSPSGLAIEVLPGATYLNTGVTVLWNSGTYTLRGTFTLGGDVSAHEGDWLVELGSDITFGGDVLVTDNNATLGADEDGGTTSLMATLRFQGDFAAVNGARLAVGEGNHYFAGDIDLSAGDDLVIGPTAANTDPTVHLTGAAQAIDFSANGSYFVVTSVAATTSVTQSGRMILAGDLNLAGSTQTDVWTSLAGAEVFVGDGSFGVQGMLTVSDANVHFNTLTLPQVSNGDIFASTEFTIYRAAGAIGVVYLTGNLLIEGDTTEDDVGAAVKDEYNASSLTIDGAEVELDKAAVPVPEVLVGDGGNDGEHYGPPPAQPVVPPTDFEGNGASLEVINGARLAAPLVKVGYAESNTVTGVPAPPLSEHSGSQLLADNATIDINLTGTGNGITAGHFAVLQLVESAVGGEGSYQIVSAPETQLTVLYNCVIDRGTSVGGGPNVRMFIGGNNMFLIGNSIKGLNGSGIQIRPNAVVRAFSDNTITENTNQGGAPYRHISLQGMGAGSSEYWDNNHFDDSVGTGSGGYFVYVASGSNPIQFRVPVGSPNGFGVPGFNVDAATAETFDNDGATVGVDVTWNDAANLLTAADESATGPAGLISDDSIPHQTILLFSLTGTSGSHAVNSVKVMLSAGGNGLSDSDIATATLFNDVNQNGVFDAGEELAAAALNQAVTSGEVLFDISTSPAVIASGTTVHWGVSIRFAASANGQSGWADAVILPGDLVLGTPASGIVAGLPLLNDLPVTGPATQLVLVTQPGGATVNAALAPQPVLELRDSNGNRVWGDSTTTVTASILTDPAGGSVLGGTVAVAAVDGQVTFTNLSINKTGAGFVLRFTAGAMTADSNAITITAAPSGGGGGSSDDGCTTGGNGGMPWLLLLAMAAVAAFIVRRARGNA